VVGDAHDLPFPDDQFICATVGFGVRNYAEIDRAMREMARVVAPGGKLVVLEIVRTQGRLGSGRLFRLYFRYVTPWLGALLARDREAYTYLPESVAAFYSVGELARMMEAAGLQKVRTRSLALGTVAIVSGEKG
jgi:demethylmenaquinone methyltransferase/2-methoxy-6-polyprenyl-1,4-benzoquinol methylase